VIGSTASAKLPEFAREGEGFPDKILVPTLNPVPARLLATRRVVIELEEAVRRLDGRQCESGDSLVGAEEGDDLGEATHRGELVSGAQTRWGEGETVGVDEPGHARLEVQLKGLPDGERNRGSGQGIAGGNVDPAYSERRIGGISGRVEIQELGPDGRPEHDDPDSPHDCSGQHLRRIGSLV